MLEHIELRARHCLTNQGRLMFQHLNFDFEVIHRECTHKIYISISLF
uniref:Uncharacterized protein n=1 Tax=Anguilla anguilla TaxID=7936 RepID=A0A0E9WKE3_ANGAN